MKFTLRFKNIVVVFILLGLIGLTLKFDYVFAQSATETPTPTQAPDNDKQKDLENKIKEYEEKVAGLKTQANTLSSQIKLVDNQIAIAELRVQETEEKIQAIEEDIDVTRRRIDGLEKNIDQVTKAMVNRVAAVYQVGTIDPLQMLLTSSNIDNFLTRLKYLQVVQLYDKQQIYASEQAKTNYEQERALFEEKQEEAKSLQEKLEAYNQQLENDKGKKKDLLSQTQNDEKKYQQLLAQARSEYEAIQGIVAGRGSETEARHVSEGERIASVIQGASCNSSGTHLHFIVNNGGSTQNPFSYLKPVDSRNCSGGGSCSEGDPFNPTGSWNWPIDPPIQFFQGYGETWAVRNTWAGQIYSFHNGIDIGTTGSWDVKAVKSGTLYQGSYGGSGGCRLRYVRVRHDEGEIDTFYLHINY